MSATLTHSAGKLTTRKLTTRKSPKSAPSWFARLIAFLSLPAEIFAEARDEQRKAHERYPFVE
jgi:hypothetical protein